MFELDKECFFREFLTEKGEEIWTFNFLDHFFYTIKRHLLDRQVNEPG